MSLAPWLGKQFRGATPICGTPRITLFFCESRKPSLRSCAFLFVLGTFVGYSKNRFFEFRIRFL